MPHAGCPLAVVGCGFRDGQRILGVRGGQQFCFILLHCRAQRVSGSGMVDNPYKLTIADACRVAECSRTTLWRMVKAGKFPQPKRLGPGGKTGRLRWREADLAAWAAARIISDATA